MEHSKVCEHCKKDFTASRSDARFCSGVCRTMQHKKNKQGKDPDPDNKPKEKRFSTPKEFAEDTIKKVNELEEIRQMFEYIKKELARYSVGGESYLTSEGVREYLSISKRTYERYLKRGILKSYSFEGSKRKYFKLSDIEKDLKPQMAHNDGELTQ